MIEILPESNEKCVVAHFSGKVTGQEYQQFIDAVDERLKGPGPVNLVLQLSGLEFYGDWAAVKKDIKFTGGELKKIHKTALVGDQKWINLYMGTIGHLTPTEEKHFADGKTQEAVEWANA